MYGHLSDYFIFIYSTYFDGKKEMGTNNNELNAVYFCLSAFLF